MTSATSMMTNVFSHCPNFPLQSPSSMNSPFLRLSLSSSSFPSVPSLRFLKIIPLSRKVHCFASAAAAGSSGSDGDLNPYEVLGVNPIEGFDMIKAAYTKKRKDAENRGDEATAALLERAYDKIMMAQLMKRKKGETFGSFKVSKDIKYADKEPVVPWGPRYSKSEVKDMRINMAISAVFIAWIFIQRSADWKPIQFLSFVFVYRIFEKLKAFEPPASPIYNEEGEDESRALRMGKRLFRSFCLVFGCIALASLAFTGVLNLIEFSGSFIPASLYSSQELIVTTASAIILYILASYYR